MEHNTNYHNLLKFSIIIISYVILFLEVGFLVYYAVTNKYEAGYIIIAVLCTYGMFIPCIIFNHIALRKQLGHRLLLVCEIQLFITLWIIFAYPIIR